MSDVLFLSDWNGSVGSLLETRFCLDPLERSVVVVVVVVVVVGVGRRERNRQ